jgi:hypothetical protein
MLAPFNTGERLKVNSGFVALARISVTFIFPHPPDERDQLVPGTLCIGHSVPIADGISFLRRKYRTIGAAMTTAQIDEGGSIA